MLRNVLRASGSVTLASGALQIGLLLLLLLLLTYLHPLLCPPTPPPVHPPFPSMSQCSRYRPEIPSLSAENANIIMLLTYSVTVLVTNH